MLAWLNDYLRTNAYRRTYEFRKDPVNADAIARSYLTLIAAAAILCQVFMNFARIAQIRGSCTTL